MLDILSHQGEKYSGDPSLVWGFRMGRRNKMWLGHVAKFLGKYWKECLLTYRHLTNTKISNIKNIKIETLNKKVYDMFSILQKWHMHINAWSYLSKYHHSILSKDSPRTEKFGRHASTKYQSQPPLLQCWRICFMCCFGQEEIIRHLGKNAFKTRIGLSS